MTVAAGAGRRSIAAGGALAPILALGLALGGCASFPQMQTKVITPAPGVGETSFDLALKRRGDQAEPRVRRPVSEDEIAALVSKEPITVVLPPQPLPQLINTVFGDLLRVPYVLGPGIANRTDGVAIRGVNGMSKRAFFRAVQNGLRDFGVELYAEGGVITVVNAAQERQLPASVVRAYSPEVPEASRPTEEAVALSAVRADAALSLLRDVLPSSNAVAMTVREETNSIVLAGPARDVAAAGAALRFLDRAEFAGRLVARVEPTFLSAEDFANALDDALAAEGVGVSRQASRQPVVVLAFPVSNQVLAFATSQELLARIQSAVTRLDQPAGLGDQAGTFVYQVRNTDAQSLASLLSGMSGGGPQGPAGLPLGSPGAPALNTAGAGQAAAFGAGPGAFQSGRLMADPVGNRILFTGPPGDFVQLRSLLARLDTPPRQVLVEVTIAEVTLDDQTRLGLEYFFNASMGDGTVRGGTKGGLGLGGSGLNLSFKGTDLRAQFNAFASNSKVNILSRPRLVARSGSEASIQVGTDVPIVTTQGAAPVQTGGSTEILQSIQYRQTGVILKIRPVVYGDNRIDLTISQEVSSQQANPNTAIASPIILNRDVTTQLSLSEGATAVLGGLIENNYTKGNSGIPLLKDVPVLGSAFRVDSVSGNKTELVVLVTPYIIRDAEEMTAFARTYAEDMNAIFRVGRGASYTLTAFGGPGLGLDLPQVAPASERR